MTERTIAPVMRTVTVRCSVERAFRVFTEEIGSWWPFDVHSRAVYDRDGEGVKAETAVIEGRAGGRVYEVMSDGTEGSWGEVLVWEPPHRLVLAWKPNARPPEQATELEIRFAADGSDTRVDLEHRSWERLGPDAMESREDYANGWPLVFDQLYAAAANRDVA